MITKKFSDLSPKKSINNRKQKLPTIDLRKKDIGEKINIKKTISESESLKYDIQKRDTENKDREILFSWIIKDKNRSDRGFYWYFGAAVLVVTLIIVSIIQKNWLFLMVVLLSVLAYYLVNKNRDSDYTVNISKEGVEIGNNIYDFNELKGFGFNFREKKEFLILETNKLGQKYISIPLGVNKESLGDFLINFIPEKEYEDTLMDALEQLFKF